MEHEVRKSLKDHEHLIINYICCVTVKTGRLLKALGEQEHQSSEFSALVVE